MQITHWKLAAKSWRQKAGVAAIPLNFPEITYSRFWSSTSVHACVDHTRHQSQRMDLQRIKVFIRQYKKKQPKNKMVNDDQMDPIHCQRPARTEQGEKNPNHKSPVHQLWWNKENS